MKYLQITAANIQQMKQDEFNLIVADTGSGKTTAIVRDLVAYCEANKKKILYLVPLKSLEEKLLHEYDNTDTINFHTYQWLGTYFDYNYAEKYDYIVFDECHTLLTNANFDANCYKLMKYINNKKDVTFVGLTATPQPLYFMRERGYLHKEINKIDVESCNHATNGKIYLVHNKEDLFKVHEKALNEGYKVISFTNDTATMNDFSHDHTDFSCACITSKDNENAKMYNTPENKYTRKMLVQNETMTVDHLTTTTALELGISIKQDTNFLISFESNYMPHTIEQAKSRVRATDENLKVDMVFQIKTKYSPIKKIEKIQREMNEHNDIDDEKHNSLAFQALIYQHEFYENQLTSDFSQEILYIAMLEKMYPDKEIIVLESWDLFDVSELIEEYMYQDVAEITPDELPIFREQLKEMKLDKKNPNRAVGLSRFKKYLQENELPYEVASKTSRKGTKWIITRKYE